ncbi:MAG: radical SAM protein [Candidatus Omnitrophota bacterium]
MVNNLKKIALVLSPPFWPNLPPLSLVMLSGYLRNKHLDVSVFDLNNIFFNQADQELQTSWKMSCNKLLENMMPVLLRGKFTKLFNQYIDKLAAFDYIGFSCYQSNIDTTLGIVELLKIKNKDLKIILGGPEISRVYFKTNGAFTPRLKELADCLVAGEGEIPFSQFVQGETVEKIVLFREQDDLSENEYVILGYPDSYVDLYPRTRTVSLLFSRGCIRGCRFCSERLLTKRFKSRSVDNLIHEIEFHKDNRVKVFVFHDSMLNADLNKLEQLCDAVIEKFGSIPWEAQIGVRADMPENLMTKMKQSGCYNLFIGLESGSNRILQKMNKGFSPEEAAEFFRKLKSAGLFFGVSLMVGFPEESEEESQESLDFLIKHKDIIPKIEQINPFVYYDGTDTQEKYDYRRNQDIVERTNMVIDRLKKEGFKMTNAFLNNLVEK